MSIPQQRLLLEGAWEALEDAGIDPGAAGGPTGVFVGLFAANYGAAGGDVFHRCRTEGYLAAPALPAASPDRGASPTSSTCAGPAVTVQTACSTSLVAVHLACQSLLSGECDLALAGGVVGQRAPARPATYQPRAGSSRPTATAGRSTRDAAGHGVRQRGRASWSSSGSPTRCATATTSTR